MSKEPEKERVAGRDGWKKGAIALAGLLVLLSQVGGCNPELLTETPYANLVGAQYVVVASDLHAYSVYGDWPEKRVTYATLIPGVGIAGYEIPFRTSIPKGTIVRIERAWRQRILFMSEYYYEVTIENVTLPRDVPIKLELSGGNEGDGIEPNPSVYRKLPTTG